MDWKTEKDGLTVTFRKGDLTVLWDLGEHRYEVRRKDGDSETAVEKGSTRHMDIETFLFYVETAWGNGDNVKE